MMIYLILALFLLSWSLFIFKIKRGKRLDGFFLKGITSFAFVFLFAYGVYDYFVVAGHQVTESVLILMIAVGLGLVLGLIGDLFLEVQYFHENQKIRQIRYGMLVFSFVHVFYILGITEMVSFNYFSLLIGTIMTLIVYVGSKFMNIDFGRLKLMSLTYTFFIFTMVGMTVFQAIDLAFNAYSLSFMIGAILFGISDLLLAPIYFKQETSDLFVIGNLGTYYLGQIFIALAIFFL